MRKLLSANFFALLHSKRVWFFGIFMAGMAVFGDVNLYRNRARGWNGRLDDTIMEGLPLLFIIMPAMAALFINTDYHDGTIRNKLSVGRSRAMVYLANLITVNILNVCYTLLYVGVVLVVGLPIGLEEPGAVAGQVLMFLLVMASLLSISVFAATMITNRSVLVWTVLMTFVMIFGAQMIEGMLLNTKTVPDYSSFEMVSVADSDDGGFITMQYVDKDGNPIDPADIPMIDNPHYVKEPMRTILRKVNTIQPGGQMMEILGGHQDLDENDIIISVHTPWWEVAIYAVLVILAYTVLGLALFQRKDLK